MDLTKSLIEEQRKKLIQEKENAHKQITALKQDDPFSDPEYASDNAAVDTDVREQIGHDTIEAEIKDLEKRVRYIDIALQKIEKGEYGYCERCHMQIPLPRLKFIPEARYCVECENQLVK